MAASGKQSDRAVLRGGYESRALLSVVALVFLLVAVVMVADPGDAGLAGTLLVAVPVAALALGLLWLSMRSAVVVTVDEVVVRDFADPRTRRVPRHQVVSVGLVDCSSPAMPAVVPQLRVDAGAGRSQDDGDIELTPLVVWTWWRSGPSRRGMRLVEQLNTLLGLRP